MRYSLVITTLLCLACASPTIGALQKSQPKAAPNASISYVKVPEETYTRVLNELLKKSDEAWHQGDFETAEFSLKMVTELDPGDEESWCNRAWILWSSLHQDDQALEVLRQGIQANPKSSDIYFDLGQLRDRRGEYAQAAEAYRKSLALGGRPIIRHALAHALEMDGKVEEAKQAWKEAIKTDPNDDAAKKNLARLERGEVRKPEKATPPTPKGPTL